MNTEIKEFVATKRLDTIYILIKWPFVQPLTDYDWFENECILYQASDQQRSFDEAYFVPVKRFYETGLPG